MKIKVCAKCEYCWEGSEKQEYISREPCPNCSSTARLVTMYLEEKIRIFDSIGGKIKVPNLPSKKKVIVEFFYGYEWSVELQKYINKSKNIDKRQDYYHEKIEDPDSGEIIHECKEPLSKHQGHGYAKFKSKNK